MGWSEEIEVDLWRTSTHSVNIGLKKQEEHMSKSRQFTKDTEFFGEAKKDGKTVAYLTYREEKWKDDSTKGGLIIKLFSESIRWKASFEELIAKELANSLAANKPMPFFIMNSSNSKVLFSFEKVIRHASLGKDVYSLFVVDDEKDEIHIFRIEEDRLTLGKDWAIYNQSENKIGEIDGSKFNIGGKYTIRLDKEQHDLPDELENCLIAFAGANRFLEDIEKRIEEKLDQLKKEEMPLKVDSNEMALYRNPRMLRI
ncbi:MAG: hypothetical protein D6732_15225 [Methanobacteriota archaeon]|nr:MAG: hypothetical protein D6732_15225 [Euryarchaeota archaeon]